MRSLTPEQPQERSRLAIAARTPESFVRIREALKKTVCKHGHPLTEDSVYLYKKPTADPREVARNVRRETVNVVGRIDPRGLQHRHLNHNAPPLVLFELAGRFLFVPYCTDVSFTKVERCPTNKSRFTCPICSHR
jgi:hypothetical protein